MGFNKRYIDKEKIVYSFTRRDRVVTAYQEGRENDVSTDITDEVLKLDREKPVPLNDFEKYCLDNTIDPYLQTK